MRDNNNNKKGGKGKSTVRRDEKYRVNAEIRASEVRLIDEEGKMAGVMSSDQAFQLAQSRGLDLIEIAPNAKPPTCKIMDYGKWKYENKKKQTAAKKKQSVITIKEIQVRPRTEQHDLDTKLKHARRFLLEGDKVKINLRFMGREMAHQEIGFELLEKLTKDLAEISVVETAPKKEGRQLFVLLSPDAVKIKEYNKKNQESGVDIDEKEAEA
ncbi:MAG: translation initiation factor IF-3 [Bdellovibrionales bacterium]|nr:translation initiation factor IF-3 [Bdellovibrionales bacterium]